MYVFIHTHLYIHTTLDQIYLWMIGYRCVTHDPQYQRNRGQKWKCRESIKLCDYMLCHQTTRSLTIHKVQLWQSVQLL